MVEAPPPQYEESENVFGKFHSYTIDFLSEIGKGNFGTVYKGYDAGHNVVAIKKVLKITQRKASKESMKSHYLKQRTVASNNHVVKLHDVRTWKDAMWIVMEFCDLGDLNQIFEKYISKGIAYLHSKNIVHRDVKPKNILVKTQNGDAVVKLGDFGLSKFLDPEGQTSGMSSDVGTRAFKAPEFWDRKPNGRVRYHRNVDVYAAGLTFTAMLQAIEGQLLEPHAEGSLELTETNTEIGKVANNRMVNRHPDIRVVVPDRRADTVLEQKVKKIIEKMTRISPQDRLSAAQVEDMLKSTFAEKVLAPRFSIPAVARPNNMCFQNSLLVVPGCLTPQNQSTIRVLDGDTGTMVEEWQTHCQHNQVLGPFVPFMIRDKEFLLEGCAWCRVIRGYGFHPSNTVLFENIAPIAMCPGPKDTLLVYDGQRSIVQLTYFRAKFHFAGQVGFFGDGSVVGMCYCDDSDILVVVILGYPPVLQGIQLLTKQVIWQHTGTLESPLSCVSDVVNLPDGIICVKSGSNLFALDPKDGKFLGAFFGTENFGRIWKVAACSGHNQGKLVIRHGDASPDGCNMQISCYDITSRPPDPDSREYYVSLQDITCTAN